MVCLREVGPTFIARVNFPLKRNEKHAANALKMQESMSMAEGRGARRVTAAVVT